MLVPTRMIFLTYCFKRDYSLIIFMGEDVAEKAASPFLFRVKEFTWRGRRLQVSRAGCQIAHGLHPDFQTSRE